MLDLAAGTGGSTAALLPALGPQGRVDCVEPARAMAQAGRQRLGADARVRWLASLAAADGLYERIVCGAALWQCADLPALLRRLSRRLAPGGADATYRSISLPQSKAPEPTPAPSGPVRLTE